MGSQHGNHNPAWPPLGIRTAIQHSWQHEQVWHEEKPVASSLLRQEEAQDFLSAVSCAVVVKEEMAIQTYISAGKKKFKKRKKTNPEQGVLPLFKT